MTPTRPAGVSEKAVVLYPGQLYGPGYGVQTQTLYSIAAQVQHANAIKQFNYNRAKSDWDTNDQIYKNLKLSNPIPAPVKPTLTTLKITYADISGAFISAEIGSNGLYYCWVEEVEET